MYVYIYICINMCRYNIIIYYQYVYAHIYYEASHFDVALQLDPQTVAMPGAGGESDHLRTHGRKGDGLSSRCWHSEDGKTTLGCWSYIKLILVDAALIAFWCWWLLLMLRYAELGAAWCWVQGKERLAEEHRVKSERREREKWQQAWSPVSLRMTFIDFHDEWWLINIDHVSEWITDMSKFVDRILECDSGFKTHHPTAVRNQGVEGVRNTTVMWPG